MRHAPQHTALWLSPRDAVSRAVDLASLSGRVRMCLPLLSLLPPSPPHPRMNPPPCGSFNVCVFSTVPPTTSFFLFLATHVPPATTNPFHTPPSPLASWLISTRYRLSVDLQMVEITACRRWCTPLPAIVLPFLFPLQCHCTQWVSLSLHTHTRRHTRSYAQSSATELLLFAAEACYGISHGVVSLRCVSSNATPSLAAPSKKINSLSLTEAHTHTRHNKIPCHSRNLSSPPWVIPYLRCILLHYKQNGTHNSRTSLALTILSSRLTYGCTPICSLHKRQSTSPGGLNNDSNSLQFTLKGCPTPSLSSHMVTAISQNVPKYSFIWPMSYYCS